MDLVTPNKFFITSIKKKLELKFGKPIAEKDISFMVYSSTWGGVIIMDTRSGQEVQVLSFEFNTKFTLDQFISIFLKLGGRRRPVKYLAWELNK